MSQVIKNYVELKSIIESMMEYQKAKEDAVSEMMNHRLWSILDHFSEEEKREMLGDMFDYVFASFPNV